MPTCVKCQQSFTDGRSALFVAAANEDVYTTKADWLGVSQHYFKLRNPTRYEIGFCTACKKQEVQAEHDRELKTRAKKSYLAGSLIFGLAAVTGIVWGGLTYLFHENPETAQSIAGWAAPYIYSLGPDMARNIAILSFLLFVPSVMFFSSYLGPLGKSTPSPWSSIPGDDEEILKKYAYEHARRLWPELPMFITDGPLDKGRFQDPHPEYTGSYKEIIMVYSDREYRREFP